MGQMFLCSNFVAIRGSDFRSSFAQLGGLRALTDVPFIALTASAPAETEKCIIESLHLESPVITSRTLDRPNIFFSISKSVSLEVSLCTICRSWFKV